MNILDFKTQPQGLFILAIIAAILAAISSAISNRPCGLLAIPRRFESPVVYTGDLKSQQKSPV